MFEISFIKAGKLEHFETGEKEKIVSLFINYLRASKLLGGIEIEKEYTYDTAKVTFAFKDSDEGTTIILQPKKETK